MPEAKGITFDHTKCIVLYYITSHSNLSKDNEIRKSLGRKFAFAIFDRIMRYGAINPKIMVQLRSSEMVDQMLSNWDSSLLGGCKARKPVNTADQPKLHGVARGVPLDLY